MNKPLDSLTPGEIVAAMIKAHTTHLNAEHAFALSSALDRKFDRNATPESALPSPLPQSDARAALETLHGWCVVNTNACPDCAVERGWNAALDSVRAEIRRMFVASAPTPSIETDTKHLSPAGKLARAAREYVRESQHTISLGHNGKFAALLELQDAARAFVNAANRPSTATDAYKASR